MTRNVSRLGLSVKCIETGGVSLRSMLVKLDLTGCIMPECILCDSGQRGGSHTRSGSAYSGKCKLCQEENKVSEYFGEAGSGGYCRIQKHIQEIKSQDLSNGFAKHLEVHHKDQVKNPNVFDMKIEKTFKKNLDRQVYEGHRIATNKCDILLNSKSEFHGPAVPRVTTTKEPTANNSNNRSQRQGS